LKNPQRDLQRVGEVSLALACGIEQSEPVPESKLSFPCLSGLLRPREANGQDAALPFEMNLTHHGASLEWSLQELAQFERGII
jgi:hypothetical protein